MLRQLDFFLINSHSQFFDCTPSSRLKGVLLGTCLLSQLQINLQFGIIIYTGIIPVTAYATDAISFLQHMMPTVLEGFFEFFVSLLRDALELPTNLLNSLLTLLKEYIRLAPGSGLPRRIPVLMYKHLQTFMYLVLFSPIRSTRDQSYDLSVAAMLSTGAFDRNPREVNAWFLFLPGFYDNKCSLVLQQTKILPTLSQAVISFLADAISTVGNNLFKYWDSVRNLVNNSNDLKDYSGNPFSHVCPLFAIMGC